MDKNLWAKVSPHIARPYSDERIFVDRHGYNGAMVAVVLRMGVFRIKRIVKRNFATAPYRHPNWPQLFAEDINKAVADLCTRIPALEAAFEVPPDDAREVDHAGRPFG